jgi:hypothetical protein
MTPLWALVQDGTTIIEYRDYPPIGDQSTLAPGKPQMWPVVYVNDEYDPIAEVREGPVVTIEPEQVIWTFTVRPKTDDEIHATLRQGKINQVHNEATQRIAPLVAGTQQVEAHKELVQLLYKHTDISAWPAGDQDLANAMLARLTDATDVRQVEDDKISELQALTDPTVIDAYDPTTGWPT